jgi:NADH-quinone oxidoreductase subunit G
MVKIFIDEREFEVQEGSTVLEAAENNGIHIPHLCYHKAFPPEGSCRLCLVEIEGLPKLELACSTRVREGMKVSTQSERALAARKGVLQCLLAEHPLDCPICDKAGECRLQDYYEEYGLFESEFEENKERRPKKIDIGKTLILDRERCILCTRCVRFLREVTKTEELGVFQRSIRAEVGLYDGVLVDNNYSGNLVEVCPVGAITDKDFRFKTRSWFLKSAESICPLCSRGCNIAIESHIGFSRFSLPKRVYRVHARENQDVNGLWICDKGRYGYSYLDEGRLEKITGRGLMRLATWEEMTSFLAERLRRLFLMKRSSRLGLVLHTWLTNEELFLVDRIFRSDLGIEKIRFLDPPEKESDEFLLTSERTPNRRGAEEQGFEVKDQKWEGFFDNLEILILFASPFINHSELGPLKAALGSVETKILFSSHQNEIDSSFDHVFPIPAVAEKAGSFTNVEGVIQVFYPALEAQGECRPEWKFLVDLAKELNLRFSYYSPFLSPDHIRKEMRKEIPFYGKNSE